MRITYLPSSVGECTPATYLTTYIVDESLAIDAGCLGFWSTPSQQAKITDIVLTHSHVDHIASLPIFLLNVYRPDKKSVRVYASAPVLESLHRHYMTDATWLPLEFMQKLTPPMVELIPIQSGQEFQIGAMTILPIEVSHTVPTLGLILRDQVGSVAVTSDTGPTEAFWKAAALVADLKAVFIEASFPSDLESIAVQSGHLTPALLAAELDKLGRRVPAIAMHIKPAYYDRVAAEIAGLNTHEVEVVVPGKPYIFGP